MLPKRLALYQALYTNIKFNPDNKDFYLGRTGLGNYSTSNTSSSDKWGSMIGGLLGMGTALGVAAMTNSQSKSGVKTSNKQVSNAAAEIVKSYPTDIAEATTNFNNKYASLGATINNDGSVTRTYEQIKADIQGKIDNLKKQVDNKDNSNSSNLDAYNNAKAIYDGLNAAQQNYNNMSTQLENIKTQNAGKITVQDNGNATPNEPNASEFTKYLPADVQNLIGKPEKDGGITQQQANDRAKETQAYKNEVTNRKSAADSYNNTLKAQKDILSQNGVNSLKELTKKINEAKSKMEEAGSKNVDKNGGMTASQYDAALSNYESQLAQLGSKADFDTAVNEVKTINESYKSALQLQQAETNAQEQANAAAADKKAAKIAKRTGKNGKVHTGLRGAFYDMIHKDKNNIKVVDAKNRANASASSSASANATLQELYDRYKTTDT